MKKYFLLFLMAGLVSLSACSSDDDGDTTPEVDPIVGTWILTDVNTELIDPEACENRSTITFNENNTGSGTFYLQTSGCEPETSTANWERINSSVYSIELPIPLVGRQEGTVEFPTEDTFRFSPQGIPGMTLTFERE